MRKYVQPIVDAFLNGKIAEYPSMFSDGRAIYSYGRHFPLVLREDGKLYLNQNKYSVTTSRQQGDVGYALHLRGYKATGETSNTVEGGRGYTFAEYESI